MNSYILCNIFMFDLHQRVILVGEDGGMREVAVANLENLDEMVLESCAKHGVNKIHLIGQQEYADQIAKNIYDLSVSRYGNNNIVVEVN